MYELSRHRNYSNKVKEEVILFKIVLHRSYRWHRWFHRWYRWVHRRNRRSYRWAPVALHLQPVATNFGSVLEPVAFGLHRLL